MIFPSRTLSQHLQPPGGLISATILTLIVLPTLYVMFERRWHHGHPGPQPSDHADAAVQPPH